MVAIVSFVIALCLMAIGTMIWKAAQWRIAKAFAVLFYFIGIWFACGGIVSLFYRY